MKEKVVGSLILLVILIVANVAAKIAFAVIADHHIDLIKPMFVGISVACVMSLFKRTTLPTLPVWLGVGSFLGEISTQIAHIQL
ncbi:MAG: hypothetical protein P4L53_06655 [Candidatus Obscuribacterales bacterium]|nr:hypothetical protein [Candidatus Obscuribacterales bacterium]